MFLFPDSGTKKNFRGTVSLKTVTPHLRSIVPNVKQHILCFLLSRRTREPFLTTLLNKMKVACERKINNMKYLMRLCGRTSECAGRTQRKRAASGRWVLYSQPTVIYTGTLKLVRRKCYIVASTWLVVRVSMY